MPITQKYLDELTYKIIGCAIEVHKHYQKVNLCETYVAMILCGKIH